MSHTEKDLFGDEYTTYNDDGTKSYTTKDFFGDGYTTHHSDGSSSHTTKDYFGDGYTTRHSDGSSSHTTKDYFGDGYTTHHSDGSTSRTYKDLLGSGYTTYNSGSGGYFGYNDYLGGGDNYDGRYMMSSSPSIPLKESLDKVFGKLNTLIMWALFAYIAFSAYILFSFFSMNATTFDVHAMTQYYLWAIAGWSFTDTLAGGKLYRPRIVGIISFGIYLLFSGTAFYKQIGYGQAQAMQTWHLVFVCSLMFTTTMLVAGLAGRIIRLLISSVTFEEGKKKKWAQMLNYFVLALFIVNMAIILYGIYEHVTIWFIPDSHLIFFAVLSVVWAFTDTLSAENSNATNVFMVIGLIWYAGFLFNYGILSFSKINFEKIICTIGPSLIYIIFYKISKELGRKLRKSN